VKILHHFFVSLVTFHVSDDVANLLTLFCSVKMPQLKLWLA